MNVILTDFKVEKDWSFPTILGLDKWVHKGVITNRLHGTVKSILRFAIYFLFPLSLIFQRHRYDKIIAWQQFYGLNFAFWSRLFHLKKVNDLTVMTFIYKRKKGFAGRLYHKYINYIVTSGYIDRFICFSKEECRYYSDTFDMDKDKFVFLQLGANVRYNDETGDDGYVFTTGRSNRNYDFLVDSLSGSDYKCIIACDNYTNSHIADNISLLHDCYGDKMLELMAKCHCVVVPLKNEKISSGQLVVLQAMALGKPVICTDSEGISDYIDNGTTGFLIGNDKDQLLKALNHLYEDKDDYNRISGNALMSYRNNFTEEAMFERIKKAIE